MVHEVHIFQKVVIGARLLSYFFQTIKRGHDLYIRANFIGAFKRKRAYTRSAYDALSSLQQFSNSDEPSFIGRYQ